MTWQIFIAQIFIALAKSFLARIISSARIILLPTAKLMVVGWKVRTDFPFGSCFLAFSNLWKGSCLTSALSSSTIEIKRLLGCQKYEFPSMIVSVILRTFSDSCLVFCPNLNTWTTPNTTEGCILITNHTGVYIFII